MLATGHGTKGIHLGPVTGKTVAQFVLDDCARVPEEMEAFRPGRFAEVVDADFYASSRNVEE